MQEVARLAAQQLRLFGEQAGRWAPRPHQVPPPPGFYGWLLLAGRGAGKTDACAKYVVDHIKGPPCMPGPSPHWVGIIAPTLGDAATSCFYGPSGIRAHDPSAKLVNTIGGSVVRWPNGSEAKLFGANTEEDTQRLRSGGNRCLQWLEEMAAWRYLDTAWSQMRFGLRSGPHPHWIGSTTPKPRQLIKRLDRGAIANVVISRASMYDNPHLPEEIRSALEEEYGGTQLGRQELLGQLIDEDENALWQHRIIDAARVRRRDLPELGRISVGVDPSGGAGEQGIVVAARSKLILPPTVMPVEEDDKIIIPGSTKPNKHGYVLDDRTVHLSPDGWGRAAIKAAVDWEADEIFVETNYGGAMCVSTLRAAAESRGVNIPIKIVTATRGKKIRAEPVSAMTYQGRWHHAGTFEPLEDQLCTWHDDLGWSPDRMDAMVWNGWGLRLAHLMAGGQGSFGGSSLTRQLTTGSH